MIPESFQAPPVHAVRHHRLAPGDALFLRGQATRGLFLVEAGSMQLRRFTADGEMIVMLRAGAGETFAEASLFGKKYHCDAVASTACRVRELDRDYVLRQLQSDPGFALMLSRQFATQMQAYRRRLEILAIRNADERVLAAILDGLLVAGIKTFAAEIGLAHETVYRALSRLAATGRIEKSRRGRYALTARAGSASRA